LGNLGDGSINILKANAVKVVGAEDSIEVVLGIAAKIDLDPAGRSTWCTVTMRYAANQKRQATDANPLKKVRFCWFKQLFHNPLKPGNFCPCPSVMIEIVHVLSVLPNRESFCRICDRFDLAYPY
jgi:hypothetical protein